MPAIQIIGHRGAKGEAPENTVAGFAYARAIGLTGVEFDVRLSRDHALVVIHDNTVNRTTNAIGPVADFTATELGELDARATHPAWPEPVGVPTLAEALDVIAQFDTIQFEIKSDTPERMGLVASGVLREIEQRALARQSIVTSFDPLAVQIIQQLAPEQNRAFIGRHDDPDIVATALRLGCTQANLHQFRKTSAGLVAKAHAAGLRVGGGPCDTVEELQRAIEWGMDSVTSDEPSALLRHLQTV